jgi:hypothetical protein
MRGIGVAHVRMSATTTVSANLASTSGASTNGANIATTIGETTSGAIFAGNVAWGDGPSPLFINSLRRLAEEAVNSLVPGIDELRVQP